MSRNGFREISRSIGYPVREIMTPKEDWVFWDGEPTSRAKTAADAGSKITFIPVMKGKRVSGVIRRDDLAAGKRAKSLTAEWLIAADTSILELISLFAADPDRIYFVLQSSEIIGLVTFADLNKVPARASLYLLVAHFEAELASLIKAVCGENNSFKAYLASPRIEKLEARRDEAKARDADLSLLYYMDLTDLVTIVSKEERLFGPLGFPTAPGRSPRKQVEGAMSFTNIRNPVSHQTNLLIVGPEDIKSLNEKCDDLIKLSKKIKDARKSTPKAGT